MLDNSSPFSLRFAFDAPECADSSRVAVVCQFQTSIDARQAREQARKSKHNITVQVRVKWRVFSSTRGRSIREARPEKKSIKLQIRVRAAVPGMGTVNGLW